VVRASRHRLNALFEAGKLEKALVAVRATGLPVAPLVPPQELINGRTEFVQRVNGGGDIFARIRDLSACAANVAQWVTGRTPPPTQPVT
jgi:hypothetical protein